FRTPFSKNIAAYVGVQLLLLIAGLSAYMVYFDSLSLFFKLELFALIVLTTLICGAILEQKKWVILMERARLLIAGISLIFLYKIYFENWYIIMFTSCVVVFLMFNTWLALYRYQEYKRTGSMV
ncbi:MAG: hypothetical protein WD334_04085, partial [Chitinophagales bacterium]